MNGFRRHCHVMRGGGADDARGGIRNNIACTAVEFRQRHVGAAVAQCIEHESDVIEIGIERFEQIRGRFAERIALHQP